MFWTYVISRHLCLIIRPFRSVYDPSQEELDMKVLVFQNKKLSERIEQRKKAENELRKRIEQLENRQRTDDAVLMIVNRYWNQV